jgi:RNA polymerase sigma factor (sigma-70 family)
LFLAIDGKKRPEIGRINRRALQEKALNPRIFKQLQEANWEAISKELLAHAIIQAKTYRWRSGRIDLLPQGITPTDIVQQVIVKTISGQRKWDPDKGDLLPWLKDQVRSEVNALVKSASHRREVHFTGHKEEDQETIDRMEHRALAIGLLGDAQPENPESAILAEEEAREVEERANQLFAAVNGEPELEEVLVAIMNGCEPEPRHIAEALDVPVEDIYNRLKRIRRRAMTAK